MYGKCFFLILWLFGLVRVTYGQHNPAGQAFSAYSSANYPAAIKLYRAKLAQKPSLYDQFMLGMCYLKADSVPQAAQVLDGVISDAHDDRLQADVKVQACDALAGLYLKEMNYRQGLKYTQLYAAIFKKARFDDVNWARFHFFNANDQARCFAALGMTDSAIRVMTPYMFFTYKNLNQGMFMPDNYTNAKDSLQHDSISRFYIALLQKKYTRHQIKAEFRKAERSFTFTEERKPADRYGFLWETITCAITIYGQHVVFVERSIGNKEKELLQEIQSPFYTKAYQLHYFQQLLTCKMVKALP